MTVANVITISRTVVSLPLAIIATVHQSAATLLLAYAIYWFGDMADGFMARRLGQVTRVGAVLDVVADRACTSVCAIALLTMQPETWVAISIFLLNFMLLDCALSLSFLLWPIMSPNDFSTVDRTIYRLNWHPAAKVLNSAAVAIAVVIATPELAAALACVVLAVKVFSLVRMARLTPVHSPAPA